MGFKSLVRRGMIVMVAASVPFTAVSAAGPTVKSLTLKEALQRAADFSQDTKDAKTEISKKKLELQQARFAVKSEEEKASGLFAKPTNLSQDLQIRMKVPEARSGLFLAQEAYRQAGNRTKFELEKVYLQAMQDRFAEDSSRKRWEEAKQELEAVKTKLKYGFVDQTAKEEAEKKLEKAASDWKKAQLTAKASRLALGQKVQYTMEDPVVLDDSPDYADLSQKMLPAYIANALQTDGTLLNDVEKLHLADEKLQAARSLYAAKFGTGRMKALERLIQSKTSDTELFMVQYDALLEQIRLEWEGFFQIPFLFPIPKSIIQGERDGLRYLDDLRNGLPIALMEQTKASLKEQESRTTVAAAVRQSYLEAKGAEESYAQALKDQDAAAAAVQKAGSAYKAGMVKAEEVQAARDAQEQARQQVFMAYIAYKTAISKLNLDSGGAVSQTLRPGILPYKDIDSGLDAVKAAPAAKADGTWEQKPAVGSVLSDLILKTKGKVKATDYALFTAEGQPVGSKTPIGKPVRQLTLLLSEPGKLRVQLYSREEVLAEGRLTGSGSKGELELVPKEKLADQPPLLPVKDAAGTPAKEDQILLGTYRMGLSALTPEVYNAAAATMTNSGQGMYFSPAWAGGQWFGLDQALDPEALTLGGAGSSALTSDQASALQVTMELPASGQLMTPLSPAQLQQSAADLKKAKEQLEAAHQAAVDAHKLADVAELEVQLKDAAAQIAMLEALAKGDTAAALEQMKLVHNSDALIAALAAESSGGEGAGAGSGTGGSGSAGTGSGATGNGTGSGAGSGAGTGAGGGTAGSGAGTGNGAGGSATGAGAGGSGSPAGTGTGVPTGGSPGATAGSSAGAGAQSPAALAAEQQRSKQALQAALAAGDAPAALAQAKQLFAAAQQLAASEDGSADELATLAAAKSQLQAALDAAVKAHDAARAETLGQTLESVRQAAAQAEKDALFSKLTAIQAAAAELAAAEAPAAGGAQAEAEKQLDSLVAEQTAELIAAIGKKELEKYSETQLQALTAQAAEIEAAEPGAEAMAVQQLISRNIPVTLDAPLIRLNGTAFVPIRALSESFGASVDWDPDRMAVTVSSEEGTTECTIGSTTAYVDGEAGEIEASPVLILGRTYVPLRFVGEAIGLQIQWNEATGTIEVSKT
ncbi:copper amine oxidase N-terminal domain-containing protein [Paenibacillus rigui]|uniref:Copper amine oxidase-like N-terminal domain-containing protein n=1 Tax=Paenibacillus rigui TaxID=554312 RepID=A0A229UNR3_9BACL|nr:copper amine oxidase N-terminal domain-containing protein [Paenibacillus rigui]OXM85032.1 hypothetical protein CF651_17600 [Paenibacillus rigui]